MFLESVSRDGRGETYQVFARGEESAALRYAEESNESSDCYLMDGSVDIKVNGKAFTISAEADIHYSAEERS